MRPSEIKTVKSKITKLLLPGFRAITWVGTIYCKHQEDVDSINNNEEIDSILKCHETIHVRQAESCSDSWFMFYLKYVWQYLKNLPLIFVGAYMPYYFIAFELEAFGYQGNFKYPLAKCVGWKEFNKLSLKEKFRFAREYKNKSNLSFSRFVYETIMPQLKEKEELC